MATQHAKRGRDAEQNASHARDEQGKPKHAAIDTDGVDHSQRKVHVV